ncbi:host specificity factor TipJ family phage tail protein [Pseudomonas sp. DCB_CB]|uniref:host specificity factor TipJ family phage tail protein n=1 Tax=unclassified Pseudomonas TaxID=196821 RepID=UPI0022497B4A|nr:MULTISPECIES: host specificity factor TipJ family phage tail protein [unclassified Pseudomonas]MCX2694333.1 host specificity factor TipJ family phage tail protein [Pseudomonas sp. DCB_BZ]MCX2859464.1 host specificity factor TipJ family phage tail protein [Pseudomonas sp. DCB_CB]
MIEFYPNKLSNTAPLGTWKTDRRMTIEAWLKSLAPSYERRESPPISVVLNDEVIEQHLWHKVKFKPADLLQIYREPKGTDPFSITFALFKGAKAVLKSIMPKMPGMPSSAGSQQGDPLTEASAKGNKVKLGDPVRQVAGHQRVYPSYLAQPRRAFVAPRDQRVEMLLYIGEGECDVPLAKVKVGETPLISLGADATFTIYPPGADLSGDPAHINWFNAPEVGASSSGSAGLELTMATDLTRSATASAYQFVGDTISVPAGAGQFPEDWSSGIIIRALAPYSYEVVDGGADRDIIRGPLEMLNPSSGMLIEVAGANAGMYVVHSFTPAVPAVPADPGSASTLTGSAAPSRYDFDVTPLGFTISHAGTAYPVALNSATTDIAGLVSALNVQLTGVPIKAEQSSGVIRFVELTPFFGMPITASGASVVLGSAPVGVTGTATTGGTPAQPAEMTLNYDGGEPVVGLALGQGLATIGPRGLRYRITAFSTSLIEVERLTSSGSADEDWPGFNSMQTVNGLITLDASNLQGGYRGPFSCCPDNEKVIELEWTVTYANGLCGIGREGQIYEIPTYYVFEYRDMDVAGAWTVLEQMNYGGSLDAQGFTGRVALPYAMRAEARVRKLYKDRPGRINDEARDDATWTDLRGRMQNSPTSYPGLTVMTCNIRGGDRLSAQSESQVSVEATRILPLMEGGAGPSRDIVPWCIYQLKQRGYTDDDLDLPEWQAFHNICVARGDTYDETLDATITVKDMINNALACSFGELVTFQGLLRPVRDSARAAFDVTYGPKTQTYSPQNMTKMLKISGAMPSINDFDGVDVEFFSRTTWAWETVECRWPGDLGNKVEKIKMPGVSDRTRAWRIGMRRRGHQKFRTDIYTWETEMDGSNSGYLSFAAVADDAPKRCQSAILLGFEVTGAGTLLTSSEPLDFSAGGEHLIGVRKLDGTLSGPFTATQVDQYTARVDALDFTPEVEGPLEPPHILFGPATRWAYPTLITSSDPANGNVAMKGMPYDARVYAYDDQFPPA